MITQLRLQNWKSVGDATVYVDPVTILIGINASGKSNVTEAFGLLSAAPKPGTLTAAVRGTEGGIGVRGGTAYLVRRSETKCRIEVTVETQDLQRPQAQGEFVYSLELQVDAGDIVRVANESLTYRQLAKSRSVSSSRKVYTLYETRGRAPDAPAISAYLYTAKQGGGKRRDFDASRTILSQLLLSGQQHQELVRAGVNAVSAQLNKIQLLDPQAHDMRAPSARSVELLPGAGNLAGYLEQLSPQARAPLEEELAERVNELTETEIRAVRTEPIPPERTNVVLVIDEVVGGRLENVGATAISDGTLRYLAIVLTVLSLPEGSLLVLEEADDGIHASRTKLLLDFLREQSRARGIDIVMTTHSSALLDFAGGEFAQFTMYVHRDRNSGATAITPVDQLDKLPRIIGFGGIGTLAASGKLEEIS